MKFTNHLKQFNSWAESIGAAKLPENSSYGFIIDTVYGPLKFGVSPSDFTKTGKIRNLKAYCIFCRFEDFDKAEDFLNKHEGRKVFTAKWNFCFSGNIEDDWDYCMMRFKNELDKILIKEMV